MSSDKSNWRQKIFGGMVLLLLFAGAVRMAWELLSVVVLPLTIVVGVVSVYWFLFGRTR